MLADCITTSNKTCILDKQLITAALKVHALILQVEFLTCNFTIDISTYLLHQSYKKTENEQIGKLF